MSINKIKKDMKDITNSPLEGIGIISLDNDPMKYIVNICIMKGIYKDYCLQLLLIFPDDYPTEPPEILIYPNQGLDEHYNHYIIPDSSLDENGNHFKKLLCFHLLENTFTSISTGHSRMNRSDSISSLLLKVQNFIGELDMTMSLLPNKTKIEELMKSMEYYERTFIIKDKNKEIKIVHTWKNPYPKIYFKIEKNNNKKDSNKNISEEEQKSRLIKQNLTCFMSNLNYIDDPEIILGYSIVQKKGLGKDKDKNKDKDQIKLYPIPELITYDVFMSQIPIQDPKLDLYFNRVFKSSNNEYYNYWLPIYLNANHYSKNRTTILYSFSIIKKGIKDIKKYDFKPKQIFEILPIILNKIIIGISDRQSLDFIRCYFHYALLFKKLSIEFEEEYVKYLNYQLNLIRKKQYNVAKSIIPDIEQFFILLFFCSKDTHGEKMKKMWYCLFEEFLVRQIYWMFNDNDNINATIEKIKKKNLEEEFIDEHFKDELIKIKKDIEKKCIKTGRCFINVNDNKALVDFLNREKIIDKITGYLFSGIYDRKYMSETKINKKKNEINEDFQKFFNHSKISEKQYYYSLFEGKENFGAYFELSNNGKELYSEQLSEKYKSFKRKLEYKNVFYEMFNNYCQNYKNNKHKEIIEEFMNNAYKSQRTNDLLLITFFAQKKFEEKGFIEKLEKNYGIYLEVDNFVNEMELKLAQITSYKQLFEYIGSEYGKNKNDIEIIKDAFLKAQFKGYISNQSILKNEDERDNEEINRERGGRGRGRGEGRGRGRGEGRGRGSGRGRGRGRGRGF